VALICDTGPLYGAMDRSDVDHDACAELLTTFGEPLLVPAPVVVELEWLAASRLGTQPFIAFLDDLERGEIRIVDLVASDYLRVRELLVEYEDLGLGFVDAAIFAIVERLRETKLATLDHRHFTAVRPRHTDALQLLPA
jgi:predicted nucleic acid-binding protein